MSVMGTRADFYVGKDEKAEWVGSTAWDGYREGIQLTGKNKGFLGIPESRTFPKGKHLFDATTEEEFRDRLAQYFANREDVTLPKDGWPWPWDDSGTSDCSYWFFDGKVWDAQRNRSFDVYALATKALPEDDDEREAVLDKREPIRYPNMKSKQNVTLGNRSGLIVVASREQP